MSDNSLPFYPPRFVSLFPSLILSFFFLTCTLLIAVWSNVLSRNISNIFNKNTNNTKFPLFLWGAKTLQNSFMWWVSTWRSWALRHSIHICNNPIFWSNHILEILHQTDSFSGTPWDLLLQQQPSPRVTLLVLLINSCRWRWCVFWSIDEVKGIHWFTPSNTKDW